MASAIPIESAPSPPTCVNMVDIFAPAPPKGLQSVASGNAVNLIWEAGAEADLAGYEVLRGEAPGDTLAPLTKAIITEPSYADASARRGRTYVYEVIAVDKAGNRSGPSNRVEDIVR
jgi:fibronectin type 3 domain-containing protein